MTQQLKKNLHTIQRANMPHYEKLLIQIVHMAHIRENDMTEDECADHSFMNREEILVSFLCLLQN